MHVLDLRPPWKTMQIVFGLGVKISDEYLVSRLRALICHLILPPLALEVTLGKLLLFW